MVYSIRYLYRPRNFPEHFSVTFDFNDEDANREMRLIQVKFTAKDYFSNDVCSTVNNISGSGESQARKDLEIPVVVINPAFEHEGNFILRLLFS